MRRPLPIALLTLLLGACTLQDLDEGLERQNCQTRDDCADLNMLYPNADPCLEWTCNRRTQLCQVRGRDRDDDQVVDIACPGGADCNDSTSSVYPGAPETCDGLDNNCNSRIDEELYRATRTNRVAPLSNTFHGGPISVAHDPKEDDQLYALVADATEARVELASWQRGQTSEWTDITVSAQGGLGTQEVSHGSIRVHSGRAWVAAAARITEGEQTCTALHTGLLHGASVEVPGSRYSVGLAQAAGARCPEANDGVFSPHTVAHDPEQVLWLALEDRAFPTIRQCNDAFESELMLTTIDADAAQAVTQDAVGFEPFASIDVGASRSLLAVAEDRGGANVGVFFYVLSGDSLAPIITPLGLRVHALEPRYVRLERGNPVDDGNAIEVALTVQNGCLRDAALVIQRFHWNASKTSLRHLGRPHQILASSLPDRPALYGASTLWNGADWFIAWNESGIRTRLRRLTPVAEVLVTADDLVLFESSSAVGGSSAPHTFLDAEGRPLIVAQAGDTSPGLHETVIECIDP